MNEGVDYLYLKFQQGPSNSMGIVALLLYYSGSVLVVVAGSRLSPWEARQRNLTVLFFCPPLYYNSRARSRK